MNSPRQRQQDGEHQRDQQQQGGSPSRSDQQQGGGLPSKQQQQQTPDHDLDPENIVEEEDEYSSNNDNLPR